MLNISGRQMEKMMAQLGIKTEHIEAEKVIIKRREGDIEISEPNIVKMVIQNHETFQITGNVRQLSNISEEDIRLIVEQTGATREEAERALKETNDIAQAIIKLKK